MMVSILHKLKSAQLAPRRRSILYEYDQGMR
jgi:hypothetical protein